MVTAAKRFFGVASLNFLMVAVGWNAVASETKSYKLTFDTEVTMAEKKTKENPKPSKFVYTGKCEAQIMVVIEEDSLVISNDLDVDTLCVKTGETEPTVENETLNVEYKFIRKGEKLWADVGGEEIEAGTFKDGLLNTVVRIEQPESDGVQLVLYELNVKLAEKDGTFSANTQIGTADSLNSFVSNGTLELIP